MSHSFKLKPNKTRDRILSAIAKNPNATMRELKITSGAASPSVVQFHVLRLVMAGYISFGTKYIVLKKK